MRAIGCCLESARLYCITRTGAANSTTSYTEIMRLNRLFVLLIPAFAMAACDTPTGVGCDAVPSRVFSTSGDTIQTVSGLRYIETQIGTGREVRTCDVVEVGYVGRLEDGTIFDQGTLQNVVPGGRMGFIAGFEQALIGMRVGGQRRAIIPPHLGYGAGGGGAIPPNATLIFDLDLRSIAD
jgi:peptidylprolyl isomerase